MFPKCVYIFKHKSRMLRKKQFRKITFCLKEKSKMYLIRIIGIRFYRDHKNEN